MTITQVGSRYCVETKAGRLHVLNEKSLKWNLKHVFKMNAKQISAVFEVLSLRHECKVG